MDMVSIHRDGQKVTIAIEGEMTIFNAQQIVPLLDISDTTSVELDLSRVSEFDTSGFQILIALKKECEIRGIELQLKSMSEAVKGLLDIFRMAGYFQSRMA